MLAIVAMVPQKFTSSKGELWVTLHGRGIASSKMVGYCDMDIATHLMGPLDRIMLAGHRLTAFHDWEGVTGYDPRCRVRLTTWGVRFRNQIDGVHILTRSKVVTMGVTVATIVLPHMVVTYSDRALFEKREAEAIASVAGHESIKPAPSSRAPRG